MDPKVIDLLEKLGAKVSNTGAQAFEIAVKGAYADSLAGVIMAGILLVLALALLRVCIYATKRATGSNNTYEEDGFIPVAAISGAFTVLLVFIALINLSLDLPGLFAPEWKALQALAGLIR
jgi:hypothetical protein